MGTKVFHLSSLLLCSNSFRLFSGYLRRIHVFPALPLTCSCVLATIAVLSRSLPLSPLPFKVNPLALPCFTSSLGTLRSQSPCSATSQLVLSHRLNKTLPTPSSLLSTAFSNSYHNSSPGWKTFCHFFPTKTLDFWPQVRRTSSSSAHLVMRIFLNKQR